MIVVRQEVSNFDSSVVVHELELAINRALYVFCAIYTVVTDQGVDELINFLTYSVNFRLRYSPFSDTGICIGTTL